MGRRFFLLWDWQGVPKEVKGKREKQEVGKGKSRDCDEKEEARRRLRLCSECLGKTIDD